MTRLQLPLRLGLALIFFLALDSLAFRTGYTSILEPNSTAGYLEQFVWNEIHRPFDGPNQVLAVGDSRVGLKTRVANLFTPETGYMLATIAVPGTTPRCWYYMLREVDPDRHRYAAILIPFDTYNDREFEPVADRELDLHYLAPLLRLSDLWSFSMSYTQWPLRALAARTVLLKGMAFQQDFQAYLAHRHAREENVALVHRMGATWIYNSVWERHNLEGIKVDWAANRVTLPGWPDAAKRRQIEDELLRPVPPITPSYAAYRLRWIGAIVDRYRGARTRIVFYRLPRGPVVRPGLPEDADSSVRQLARRPGVVLADERAFDSLERPELFGDGMHLNEAGGIEFSRMLAQLVEKWLGPVREPAR
ncbi:MAG: hypothetical protein ACLQVN_15970 [Bryobacteraceae bacterium]